MRLAVDTETDEVRFELHTVLLDTVELLSTCLTGRHSLITYVRVAARGQDL